MSLIRFGHRARRRDLLNCFRINPQARLADRPSSEVQSTRVPLPGISRGNAAIDGQNVARALPGSALRCEVQDSLSYVFGQDACTERSSFPIVLFERRWFDPVRRRAFRAPIRSPDPGTLEHSIGIDAIHADSSV